MEDGRRFEEREKLIGLGHRRERGVRKEEGGGVLLYRYWLEER